MRARPYNPSINQIHLAPANDETRFFMATGKRTPACKFRHELRQAA